MGIRAFSLWTIPWTSPQTFPQIFRRTFSLDIPAPSLHPDLLSFTDHQLLVDDMSVSMCVCVCVFVWCADDYLKPVITSHPKPQVALKDGTLNLTCQAVTSPHAQITVLWKKDHTV